MAGLLTTEAIILCGGLGKRLRNLVSDRPKPMAVLGEKSFLQFLLEQLQAQGIKRIILAAGYKAHVIEEQLDALSKDLEIALSIEPEPLGTGGAVRLALAQVSGERCFVLNGDSFCVVNLAAMEACHLQQQARLTLLVTEVNDVSAAGTVSFDHQHRVTRFVEKGEHAGAGWINAGVYLLEKNVAGDMPAKQSFSLEYDVFPGMVHGETWAFPVSAPLYDIGTPDTYRRAIDALAATS